MSMIGDCGGYLNYRLGITGGGVKLVITGGHLDHSWGLGTYPEGTGSREGYWDDVGGWWRPFQRCGEPYSRVSQNQE